MLEIITKTKSSVEKMQFIILKIVDHSQLTLKNVNIVVKLTQKCYYCNVKCKCSFFL